MVSNTVVGTHLVFSWHLHRHRFMHYGQTGRDAMLGLLRREAVDGSHDRLKHWVNWYHNLYTKTFCINNCVHVDFDSNVTVFFCS